MTVALLILGFYAVFMWLVFYRFKWLKFNIAWGVVTFWVGFHVLFLLIVFLRFYTPYTIDGHVIRQTIQIAPKAAAPDGAAGGLCFPEPEGEEGRQALSVRPDALCGTACRSRGESGRCPAECAHPG